MAESVGEIFYTVTAQVAPLLTAQKEVEQSTKKMGKGMDDAGKHADKLNTKMKETAKAAKEASKAQEKMIKGYKDMLAPLAALFSIAKITGDLVKAQLAFDGFMDTLTSVTGSAEKAKVAFSELQQFTNGSLWGIDESIKAFTSLTNAGLNPSADAMLNYSNIATGLGLRLEQVTQAVTNASMGQLDGLKQLGIGVVAEGDKISLSFRGTTETIGKNTAELEGYFAKLGNTQFAGAMATAMDSLTGDLQKTKNEYQSLLTNIMAEGGLGEVVRSLVQVAHGALSELNDYISSGVMQEQIGALGVTFADTFKEIGEGLDALGSMFVSATDEMGNAAQTPADRFITLWTKAFSTVKVGIRLLVIEATNAFEMASAIGMGIKDIASFKGFGKLKAGLQGAVDARKDGLQDALNAYVKTNDDVEKKLDAAQAKRIAAQNKANAGGASALPKGGGASRAIGTPQADKGGSGGGEKNKDADNAGKYLENLQKQLEVAKNLTTQEKLQLDILSGRVKLSGTQLTKAMELAKAVDSKYNTDAIKDLQEELKKASMSASDLAQYEGVLKLNKYATAEQVQQVKDLVGALADAEYRTNKLKEIGGKTEDWIKGDQSGLSGMGAEDENAKYDAAREAEQERYAAQQQRLLEAQQLQLLSWEEFYATTEALAQNNADRIAQIEQARVQMQVGAAASGFASMAEMLKNAQGEQSSAYKAMFAVAKAFAIADATMNAYGAISKAWNSAPFPANLLAVAATAPAVMGVVSSIKGASVSGGRQYGGGVEGSKMYRVNENGAPEILNTASGQQYLLPNSRGEVVSNKDANGASGGGTSITVNLIESADRGGQVERSSNEDGDTIDIWVANIQSGGKAASALEQIYNVERVGR